MTCCKIYLTISVLIACYVNANYERPKSPSYLVPRASNQHDTYDIASSEIQPRYKPYESNRDRYGDHFGSSSENFPNTKKKLVKKKNLKKIPFSSTSKDYTAKYKELFPHSEIAYCQEIEIKSTDKIRKGITTCYKCEDPKTKSVYERCLYNSLPDESASASTKVERFSSTSGNPRYRRSNVKSDEIDYEKTQNPYRFADEYFTDATYDVPAAYKSNGEKCDKIVKDSMVCVVCQDDKTNGKYEQCSYVKKPREKAYTYTEERRNGNVEHLDGQSNPRSESLDSEESNLETKDRDPIAVKDESHDYSYPSEDDTERVSTTDRRDRAEDASSVVCKQVQRDSKTCTVCKDPKIGGAYEKCTYSYQPSDKLYKYSRTKSFGSPDKISTDPTGDLNETPEKSKRLDRPQNFDSAHHYDKAKPSTYPWRSEKIIESQQDASDFDSTSHDSPNYNDDYSDSKKSNNYQSSITGKDDTESYEDQAAPSTKPVSEESSENIDTDNCKKVRKDSMICTICKDPKTGNDFEQCSYSYQPSDKIFSYSKSSSFGSPRKNDKYRRTPRTEDEESPDSSEIAKDSYDDPGESHEASTTHEAKDDPVDVTEEKKDGVDVGYLDTTRKKAEIEEFMQNFQKKDRSKCRKTTRDKMTCYQCTDETGVKKEECVFVTGREPDQLAFREIKELQVEPASRPRDPKSSSTTKAKARAIDPLVASASVDRNSYVKSEKPDNDYPDETQHAAEENKEAEPYDYTSETKSQYDKVLGLTLPAYMFATSEHEAAFDEVVASSHDQR